MRPIIAVTSAILALLAGCARVVPPAPQAAPPRPIPRPVPVTPPRLPPPSSDWRDWPITPGTWSFRQDARGSVALFGAGGADPAVTLRCDRGARALQLSRAGDAPAASFTIRTSTLVRTLPVRSAGTTPPSIVSTLGADDRLLDAMGFSRGRFILEAPPLAALVIPAWPEILRVVEDCRG
jgi:hypothetical protein